jgi:hypothetical protein
MNGFTDVPLQLNKLWQLKITECLRLTPFLAGPRASSLLQLRMKNSCLHLELPWKMSVSRKHTNSLLTSLSSVSLLCVCVSSRVLCYDQRSVGQCVLEYSTHLGLTTRFLLLSDSCWFLYLTSFSAEKTGPSFKIASGPRQRSHSQVQVPWDSPP